MTESGVSTYRVYNRGTIDTVHRGSKSCDTVELHEDTRYSMKRYVIVFLAVIALLARSCSAAKAPSLFLCQKCKDDCKQIFMKCIKGCQRHTASGEVCVRKFNKCNAKCEKKFGAC
ncbi:hypothetical protein LSAT2_010631 [Lamellibrachia satsuma]|nr:hypothetical protein LSAT2_010631 [Lamellibrachia satsuma]